MTADTDVQGAGTRPAQLQDSPELQDDTGVSAGQMPQGLGLKSQTVNYNLSNKHQLVRSFSCQIMTLLCHLSGLLEATIDCRNVVHNHACDAGGLGVWHILSDTAFRCLDGRAGGKLTDKIHSESISCLDAPRMQASLLDVTKATACASTKCYIFRCSVILKSCLL